MKLFKLLLIVFLFTGISACVSNPSDNLLANDEDKDIGIGGTGMLANTKFGSGVGGTGVVGVITGFGSIFVNGIEIEYDSSTPFSINGARTSNHKLAIGDVVEVLTTDNKPYTHAQIINLRHEVIGKVESVNTQNASFIVNGQTILQDAKNRLPKAGEMVAVAGFKLTKQSVQATRITPANTLPAMIRSNNALPFADKATRWLVQTNVQQNKFSLMINKRKKTFLVKGNDTASLENSSSIRIFQLEKASGRNVEFSGEIDAHNIRRGKLIDTPIHKRSGHQRMQRNTPMRMNINRQPVMPRFGR